MCVLLGGVQGFTVGLTDQQRNFAARRFGLNGREQASRCPRVAIPLHFCDFAGDHAGAISENFEGVPERVNEAMRRFVKRQSARLVRQRAQTFAALWWDAREESR